MGVEWVAMLPSKIFTRIKSEFSGTLKERHKMTDDNFSVTGINKTKPVFPFVYIKMLGGSERGQDLRNASINAGYFTFQIDVTDNKSQHNAKEVAFEIMRIMKTMGFEAKPMISFEDTKDTHRATARYSRLIGNGDKL